MALVGAEVDYMHEIPQHTIHYVVARWLRQAAIRHLQVFDFDDTLVSSHGSVAVKKANGETLTMDSATFAHYRPADGDELDFGSFNDVINPRIIKKNFNRLVEALARPDTKVVILTARSKGAESSVTEFLESVDVKGVQVVGLASSDPEDKAKWIDQAIADHNAKEVTFFDDSSANAAAVAAHGNKHRTNGVNFESHNTPHPHEADYGGPAIKKHFRSKNPQNAKVKYQPKTPTRTEKPELGQRPSDSDWWRGQTDTFKHKYCDDHPASNRCASQHPVVRTIHKGYIIEDVESGVTYTVMGAGPSIRGTQRYVVVDAQGAKSSIRRDDLLNNQARGQMIVRLAKMASNDAFVKKIQERAKKSNNKKVIDYINNDFAEKMAQAGQQAGAWFDGLYSTFDTFRRKPDGLFKGWKPQDFDDLYEALFGTNAKPKHKKNASVMKVADTFILGSLLACLRAAHQAHWTAHWTTEGANFYGDHLLFDKLYSTIPGEIDGLAEKMVALYGAASVALPDQIVEMAKFITKWVTMHPTSLVNRSIAIETDIQIAINMARNVMEAEGALSLGLDNFLQGVADAHETNQYLLGQRMTAKTVSTHQRTSRYSRPAPN